MKDYYVPTEEEHNLMVKDMAERLKDIVYATAESKMEYVLKQCGLDKKVYMTASDTYTIDFKIEFITGDLLQIIGGNRRKKECRILSKQEESS